MLCFRQRLQQQAKRQEWAFRMHIEDEKCKGIFAEHLSLAMPCIMLAEDKSALSFFSAAQEDEDFFIATSLATPHTFHERRLVRRVLTVRHVSADARSACVH